MTDFWKATHEERKIADRVINRMLQPYQSTRPVWIDPSMFSQKEYEKFTKDRNKPGAVFSINIPKGYSSIQTLW